MERYVQKVNGFLNGYLKKEGYSLIQTTFTEEDHNYYLRVYIDLTEEELRKRQEAEAEKKMRSEAEAEDVSDAEAEEDCEKEEETPLGIGINDCVKVSRRLSQWLDQEDFIKEAYMLEVCSKGFLNLPAGSEA